MSRAGPEVTEGRSTSNYPGSGLGCVQGTGSTGCLQWAVGRWLGGRCKRLGQHLCPAHCRSPFSATNSRAETGMGWEVESKCPSRLASLWEELASELASIPCPLAGAAGDAAGAGHTLYSGSPNTCLSPGGWGSGLGAGKGGPLSLKQFGQDTRCPPRP